MCEGKRCLDCMWNYGAIRHYCNERGGDASFEESGGGEMRTKVSAFQEFTLIHGPVSELEGTMYEDKADTFNNKIRITSSRMLKDVQHIMGTHTPERGEKISEHTYGEGGERPQSKIYSIPRRNK